MQDVLTPMLSDEVILLRPLSRSDAHDHLAGEDEELVRWLNGGPGTVDTVARHIAAAQEMWMAGGPTFSFAIRSALDDRMAGTIDVQLQPDHAPRGFANLAYGLYAPTAVVAGPVVRSSWPSSSCVAAMTRPMS